MHHICIHFNNTWCLLCNTCIIDHYDHHCTCLLIYPTHVQKVLSASDSPGYSPIHWVIIRYKCSLFSYLGLCGPCKTPLILWWYLLLKNSIQCSMFFCYGYLEGASGIWYLAPHFIEITLACFSISILWTLNHAS